MRVGIFGGSFNPPHRGHLALARAVLERDLVDRVLLIPAAVPPHKAAPSVTPDVRFEMTRLLAAEDEHFGVDDIELRRVGPSFTIDTILELRRRLPESGFRLVIGSDMAKSFATWRCYRDLLRLAPPLVAERPDSPLGPDDFTAFGEEDGAILRRGVFPMRPVDISSTAVRRRVAEGAGDDELLALLTRPVLDVVRRRNLYRD